MISALFKIGEYVTPLSHASSNHNLLRRRGEDDYEYISWKLLQSPQKRHWPGEDPAADSAAKKNIDLAIDEFSRKDIPIFNMSEDINNV